MKTLLWLDDYRDPNENNWLVFSPIEKPFEVVWVKNFDEFTRWIIYNGLPTAICFDHDLAEEHYAPEHLWDKPDEVKKRMDSFIEKTGFDCAKWLVEYCMDYNKELPLFNIQPANPVGKENINSLLNNFKKMHTIKK